RRRRALPLGPGLLRVEDDVLDRQAGLAAEAADEVAPQPAGALTGERRDDDLVDPLVGDRLGGRGEGIRVRDLAVGVDPGAAQLGERAAETLLRLGMVRLRRVALRRDDQEA